MRNYIDKVLDFLRDVEGLKLEPYVDTTGHLTIGYGRNLSSKGICQLEAEFMLQNDVKEILDFLRDYFEDFDRYPDEVKIVLISMVFNLGENGFLGFKKFIDCVKRRDWHCAAYELLHSKRALQVPSRVKKELDLLGKV